MRIRTFFLSRLALLIPLVLLVSLVSLVLLVPLVSLVFQFPSSSGTLLAPLAADGQGPRVCHLQPTASSYDSRSTQCGRPPFALPVFWNS